MAKTNTTVQPITAGAATTAAPVSTKTLFDRALGAIKLDKKIKSDSLLLEIDKAWLRENGKGQTIPIPGYGSVQVKNGSAAKAGGEAITNYTFSIEKYKQLKPAQQRLLIDMGVVTVTHSTTAAVPEGTAAVSFTHNK